MEMYFVGFFRITRKQKKSSSNMLPPVGIDPRAYDFTTELISYLLKELKSIKKSMLLDFWTFWDIR